MNLPPKLVKPSEVIFYAIGGKNNLYSNIQVDIDTGEIDVSVRDRYKLNETIFSKIGATDIWIETGLDEDYYAEPAVKDVVRGLGGLLKMTIQTTFTNDPPDIFRDKPKYIDNGRGIIHIRLLDIASKLKDDLENVSLSSI